MQGKPGVHDTDACSSGSFLSADITIPLMQFPASLLKGRPPWCVDWVVTCWCSVPL